MAKKIVISIPLNGEVTFETKGYTGGACKEAGKFLEELGQKTSDRNTPEYYSTKVGQRQQNKA